MHGRIINVMQKLGYKGNTEGVCAGIVQAWISACLSGTEDKFNELTDLAVSSEFEGYLKTYNEQLDHVKEAVAKIAKKITELKKEKTQLNDSDLTHQNNISKIDDQIKQLTIERSNLWKQWEEKIDGGLAKDVRKVSELFEQIELYFNPAEYESFFGKKVGQTETLVVSELAASKEIEDKGGLAIIYSHPVIGKKEQIEAYFRSLEEKLSGLRLAVPIALSSDNHRIGAIYDPIDKKWKLVDPNNLPSEIIDRDKIASAVMEAFGDTNVSLFNVTLFTTQNREKRDNLKSKLDEFRNNHPITQEMTELKNDRDQNLASMIIRCDHVGLVPKLAMNKYNLDEFGYYSYIIETRPVEDAVKANNIPMIEALGKAGVNMNVGSRFMFDTNPLYHAVSSGNLQMVDVLLKYHADVNKDAGGDGKSKPIFIAVEKGNVAMVKFLAAHGADLNQADKDNETLIQVALINKDKTMLQELAILGCDLNYRDKNGNTLAHIIVERGLHDILPVLVSKGLNLNELNSRGELPIHIAVEKNDDLGLEILINLGVKTDIVNSKGQSLAHIAVQSCARKIFPVLTKHQINLNENEKTLPDVIEHAKRMAEYISRKHGFPIDSNAIYGGETPLEKAVLGSGEDTVLALVKGLDSSVIQSFQYAGQTLKEVADEKGWGELSKELDIMADKEKENVIPRSRSEGIISLNKDQFTKKSDFSGSPDDIDDSVKIISKRRH